MLARIAAGLGIALATTACAASSPGRSAPPAPLPPTPELLDATDGFTPRGALAVSPTDIVWLDAGWNPVLTSAGRVLRMPKSGGTPLTVASGQAWPADLALDGEDAYWTDVGLNTFGEVKGGSIEMATGTGARGTLAMDDFEPMGIAVASSAGGPASVYWTDNWGVVAMPPSEVPPPTLAQGTALVIAADATNIYLVDGQGGLGKIARSGGSIIPLAPPCSGTTADQGQIVLSATAQVGIVIDATSVYWLDFCGNVNRVAKAGGEVTVLGAQGPPPTKGWSGHTLAADEERLFWLEADRVAVVSKDGGAVATIPFLPNNDGGRYVGGLDVDETHVYWADSEGIWRSMKP
jgi:hypothetical protein